MLLEEQLGILILEEALIIQNTTVTCNGRNKMDTYKQGVTCNNKASYLYVYDNKYKN